MNALRLGLSIAMIGTLNVNAQELDFQAAQKIVRLPPNAFSMLPVSVVRELQRRGCTIPQEDFSKSPNNVISGQFAHRGQRDWAVLCSIEGKSSILVFWNGSATNPADIARWEDINHLQSDGQHKAQFSRGISAVGRDFILKHYRAYGGPRPPQIDHEGINDAFIEKGSVVLYFYKERWLRLTGSD